MNFPNLLRNVEIIERNIPTLTLEYDDQEANESIHKKTKQVFDYLADL